MASMGSLALTLQAMNREEGKKLSQQVLKGYKKLLGLAHEKTLRSAKNLAILLQYRHKYEAAYRIHQWVLEEKEMLLG